MKATILTLGILLFTVVVYGQQSSAGSVNIAKADTFRKYMQADSALVYYRLAITESRSAGSRENYVYASNQAGIILTRKDQYEEAKIYLDSALFLGLQDLDSNHLLIATTYLSLGVVYAAEEKYDSALMFHRKALQIRRLKLGEHHADVATSYGNIGNVYLRKKEYDRSVEAHRQAMHIRSLVYGDSSTQIIESFVGLGNAYREKMMYDSSLVYFQKALANKIRQRGEGHKDLVRFYTYIKDIYYLMGNQQQGDYYRDQADSISRD